MKKNLSFNRNTRLLGLSVFIILILIFLLGVILSKKLSVRHETTNIAQMRAIALLKANQISDWIAEHNRDAEMLRTSNLISKALLQWRTTGDLNARDQIIQRFKTLQKVMDYKEILVIDKQGNSLFDTADHGHISSILNSTVQRVFNMHEVQFTDLYHEYDGTKGHLELGFVIPIEGVTDIAVVILVDNNTFLFPFLKNWPLPSESAETLLFKQHGENILFLNELRHKRESALKLYVPMSERNVLAVQVAEGRILPGEPIYGIDYRKEPVVGIAQRVVGTPWYLIAKMDSNEFYGELRRDLFWVRLSLILSMIAVLIGGVLIQQRRKLQLITQGQRDQAEYSLDTIFHALPDLFFRLTEDGVILDYRAQNKSDLYVPEQEFIGKRMQDVLPGELAEKFRDKMQLAWRSGEVITYEYALELSQRETIFEARLVRVNKINQLIVLVRNITERKLSDRKNIRFTRVLESSLNEIYVFDSEDLHFIDVNKAARDNLGYSMDELRVMTPFDIKPDLTSESFAELIAPLRSGEKQKIMFTSNHKRKDNSLYPTEIHLELTDEYPKVFIAVIIDITKRKQEEDDLLQANLIIENSLIVLFRWKAVEGWPVELVSNNISQFGYTADEFISGDVPYVSIIHPDDVAKVASEIIHYSTSGEVVFHQVYRILTKQGEARWIDDRTMVERNESGEVIYYQGVITDITERKITEKKLSESEERFRTIFEEAPLGVAVIDSLTGEIYHVNQQFADIAGRTKKEMENIDWIEITHPDDVQEDLDNMALMNSGKTTGFNMNKRYVQPDGTYVWINMTITPMTVDDRTHPRHLCMIENITERKEIEEKLNKLAQAVEQSPESIVISNTNAEIEYVNTAFTINSGYSADEVVGENPRMLQSGNTSPEQYEKMWANLTQGRVWKGEFNNKRKDGTEYIEFAHISPIVQSDGKISHYVGVKEDITEKKKMAKELDEHRNNLEKLVALRTRELAESQRKAESANMAKSAFLANMSHEIRTPMNAIIGLTHLLQRANPNIEQKQRLSKIDTSALHLLSIINDILDLSKIESGKLVIENTNFHLNVIFDHVQSMLREQVENKGLKIEFDKNSVPIWLTGDPTRIRQALLNYAVNAVKFTEQGSIFLRAIKLEEQDAKVLVRFEVEDTGIGIDPDILPGLFDAFEQADVSTTRNYGGTGLGLAITQHLAELMGGEAGAISEPGKGSTFWFTASLGRGYGVLPDEKSVKELDSETELQTYYYGSSVLLVEDNDINREVATELLNAARLDVDSAEDGQQAVDKVRARDYDLVLMDLQMPVMDGIEATTIIRSMNDKKEIPILAMTANIFEEDRLACEKAGMNDFIAKPIELDNLFSTIIKWLPNRKEALVYNSMEAKHQDGDVTEELVYKEFEKFEGMNVSKGLKNMRGDLSAYLRQLKHFDVIHGADIHKINQELDNKEYDLARNLVHSIKGAAGTLGLIDLQGAASSLEDKLKHHDAQSQKTYSKEMKVLNARQQEFHGLLKNITIEDKRELDKLISHEEIIKTLKNLESLLLHDDASVNEQFFKVEKILKQVFGGKVDFLAEQISEFNYPAALKTLNSISVSDIEQVIAELRNDNK
ncbi:MAG: hypothetical protein DIZ80_01960 [endosymbiont of Galathealinum brachiosum]|uniref:histidine kinase n=1 Tax=endosymbiont of Galathealinum brachiosum TaxID=2200906 RepID=A0A370DLC4_9GAMM|nr:MAG: hypothetical protein DIZ80_01960 [endosymbiont of Galathealinum brachiosum]